MWRKEKAERGECARFRLCMPRIVQIIELGSSQQVSNSALISPESKLHNDDHYHAKTHTHTHTPVHVLMQTNKCTHAPTQPRTHPFLEWQSISFINCVSESFQHIGQAGITCSKALLRRAGKQKKRAAPTINRASLSTCLRDRSGKHKHHTRMETRQEKWHSQSISHSHDWTRNTSHERILPVRQSLFLLWHFHLAKCVCVCPEETQRKRLK